MLTENKTLQVRQYERMFWSDEYSNDFCLMRPEFRVFVCCDGSGVEIVDVDGSVLEILHIEMNKNIINTLVFLLLALLSHG